MRGAPAQPGRSTPRMSSRSVEPQSDSQTPGNTARVRESGLPRPKTSQQIASTVLELLSPTESKPSCDQVSNTKVFTTYPGQLQSKVWHIKDTPSPDPPSGAVAAAATSPEIQFPFPPTPESANSTIVVATAPSFAADATRPDASHSDQIHAPLFHPGLTCKPLDRRYSRGRPGAEQTAPPGTRIKVSHRKQPGSARFSYEPTFDARSQFTDGNTLPPIQAGQNRTASPIPTNYGQRKRQKLEVRVFSRPEIKISQEGVSLNPPVV